MIKWLPLLIPTLAVLYALLRPSLQILPQFKAFYAAADGFWSTAWALCGKSATISFAILLQVIGWLLQSVEVISQMLNDPELQKQVATILQANPELLGHVLTVTSMVTIAARLRSYVKDI